MADLSITINDLYQIIGEKAAEIRALEKRLAALDAAPPETPPETKRGGVK